MADQITNHRAEVRQLFDAKAPTWSTKYSSGGRLTGRLALFVDSLAIHVPADCRLLDLGCGTGELARALAARGAQATACDFSIEMLHRAAKCDAAAAVEWIRLQPGWQKLPFDPSVFDAVVAASVLEYVDDAAPVFMECARVLRPGGFMLCTVPNVAHPVRWLEWLVAQMGRLPAVRQVCAKVPRLASYLTYLKVSRQRHSVPWWRIVAEAAGLNLLPQESDAAAHGPLRLLTFERRA